MATIFQTSGNTFDVHTGKFTIEIIETDDTNLNLTICNDQGKSIDAVICHDLKHVIANGFKLSI